MAPLPDSIPVLDEAGKPLRGRSFQRVNARSDEAKKLQEADWDEIIAANADTLAASLRNAGLIGEDSTLRVLGAQVDNVDVLFAEVPLHDEAGDTSSSADWGAPARLVLLEDKLLRNSEAKRQVLAQVIDYAARAQAEWSVDYLCGVSALAPHIPWLRKHRQQLDVSIADGDFLLVIAGDDIDENLLRLARRFASTDSPLALHELCLVSLALYRRGDERLLVPHVVSAVERHHRQFTLRVKVYDEKGAELRADVERDEVADVEAKRRGALPENDDVREFLERAKASLSPRLLRPGSPYDVTARVRKSLDYAYELTDDDSGSARFKIHFGGYTRDAWWPVEVGLQVESRTKREAWHARAREALADGRLPSGTEVDTYGKQTVRALKKYKEPADLKAPQFLEELTSTLLAIEAALGPRST